MSDCQSGSRRGQLVIAHNRAKIIPLMGCMYTDQYNLLIQKYKIFPTMNAYRISDRPRVKKSDKSKPIADGSNNVQCLAIPPIRENSGLAATSFE
jgi:hypothetical protein